MKRRISFKDVLSVLHADLIGKDSHRGITLTYGWMANQLGHFALGFIPTCVLTFALDFDPFTAFTYIGLFWLLFEIYNALSPLYKKEYKGNGSFKPQWGNLTFDTLTDLFFFWFGGYCFFLFSGMSNERLLILVLSIIVLFICIRYWFLTKLYQQNAFLPYQFRLSQWDGEISVENIQKVKWFLKNGHRPHHFLVYGSNGSGKTRLTVGMANELAIRHLKSTYTTMSKWCSLIQESEEELKRSKRALWTWNESHFLLIDDINPGIPDEANRMKSTDLAAFVHSKYVERNIHSLKNMSVAWVIGKNASNDNVENWKNTLIQFGIPMDQIHLIDLDDFSH